MPKVATPNLVENHDKTSEGCLVRMGQHRQRGSLLSAVQQVATTACKEDARHSSAEG